MSVAAVRAVRALLGAVLLVGFGVAGVLYGERRAEARAPLGPPPGLVAESTLVRVLRLEGARRESVEAILSRGRERSDSLMRTMLNQVRLTVNGSQRELRAVLDPEQRRLLDSLLSVRGGVLRRLATPPPRP